MDVLVVDSEGAPLLLHNESSPVGHWLELRLVGTKSNRDGYGALVTVQAGGRKMVRLCHSDGSYMSASDKRVHVGLGDATQIEQITIRWPDGRVEHPGPLSVGGYHTIWEGCTGPSRVRRRRNPLRRTTTAMRLGAAVAVWMLATGGRATPAHAPHVAVSRRRDSHRTWFRH